MKDGKINKLLELFNVSKACKVLNDKDKDTLLISLPI